MSTSKIILIIILITGRYAVMSQSQKRVRGIIRDSVSKEILENATLTLYRLPDKSLQARTISARSGFTFHVPVGNYFITTSFIGYKNDTSFFHVIAKDSLLRLSPVLLIKESRNLLEVVVQAVIPPATIRHDTISFNANLFKTMPNATVEELLKRLPGVEVDRDGTVTVNGKRVVKIYVDGNEFFLNDSKIATQNLMASTVDRVEAFDDKSERSLKTGIPDNNGLKAINLRLKPESRKGISGKVYAGYGNNNRYSMGGSTTSLKDNGSFFVTMNSNNSNSLYTGNNLANLSSYSGSNQNNSFASSYNNKWGKLKLNSSFKANADQNTDQSIYNRQTFLQDSSLVLNNVSTTTSKRNIQQGYLKLVYDIDKMNTFSADVSLGGQQPKSIAETRQFTSVQKSTAYILNSDSTNNSTSSHVWDVHSDIGFSHKFHKKGRFIQVDILSSFNQNITNGTLMSVTRFPGVVLRRNQQTVQNGDGRILDGVLFYSEPIGTGKILGFSYTMLQSKNTSDRSANNYDSVTGKYNIPDTVSNNAFRSTMVQHTFSGTYNYFINKIRFSISMSLQHAVQDNNDLTSTHGEIRQTFNNFSRSGIFTYNISNSKSFNLNYFGGSRPPRIDQLQPIPDYSNPLFIKTGNPDLKPVFVQRMEAGYTFFNSLKFRSLSLLLDFSNEANNIVNSITINSQGIQQQKYVNVNGDYDVSGKIDYGFPLGDSKHGNGKLGTFLTYNHDISLLNGLKNTKVTLGWMEKAQANFNARDKFFAELSGSINYNKVSYSLQNTMATSFLNQLYLADLSYVFPFDLTLSSTFNCEVTGKQGSLPGRTVTVWNASVGKHVFAKKTGEFRFSVFDVLGNKSNFSRTVEDNYIESKESTVFGRMWMVSFSYNFKKKGK